MKIVKERPRLMSKIRGCELCDGEAALYCAADEAHICWACDAKVHSANFLVARHTRAVLCGACGIQTSWKASGANPKPLTSLCAECSQGESQGECTTNDDGSVVDLRRATARARPAEFSGSNSVYETGCSSSNGEVIQEETVRASLCESTSQLSCERMGDITVDSRSAQANVSSGISKSLKRKRLDCCSPVSLPQSKQIATRALEDVNRSVGHGQVTAASFLAFQT